VAVSLDVSRDDSVAAAAALVRERTARLDVVVNNAGISAMGLNEGFTASQALALLDVNALGAHRVNRAFLPFMKPHKSGLLVHISTGLARMTLPCFGLYSASKAALEAIAESYRYELSVLGIDSVIVEPGAYPTNLGASALAPADAERLRDYGPLAALPERMMQGLAAMFSGPNAPNPQEVPDAIVRLIETPAGERPLRTTVGGGGGALEDLNALTDRIQAQILGAQGMGDLLHVPKR
jgi:NAD(P)-dependent dehydrogenase (short-subunit alcohol dehydrogenase family)